MVIKPNVLQGFYFWLFGVLAAFLLLLSILILFPSPRSRANDGLGDVRGLIMGATCMLIFVTSYRRFQRSMRMTLSTQAKAALFAVGIAFIGSVWLAVYLSVRGGL